MSADATFTPGYKFSMGCWKRSGCKNYKIKCLTCDRKFSEYEEIEDEPEN